jgi:hypothetical protein
MIAFLHCHYSMYHHPGYNSWSWSEQATFLFRGCGQAILIRTSSIRVAYKQLALTIELQSFGAVVAISTCTYVLCAVGYVSPILRARGLLQNRHCFRRLCQSLLGTSFLVFQSSSNVLVDCIALEAAITGFRVRGHTVEQAGFGLV